MGLRFHKALKLFPGVKLNFSKSGASVSLGQKGMTYNIGTKGTKTTVGIPGSGLSYSQQSSYDDKAKNENKPEEGKSGFPFRLNHPLVMFALFLIGTLILSMVTHNNPFAPKAPVHHAKKHHVAKPVEDDAGN